MKKLLLLLAIILVYSCEKENDCYLISEHTTVLNYKYEPNIEDTICIRQTRDLVYTECNTSYTKVQKYATDNSTKIKYGTDSTVILTIYFDRIND